MQVDWQRSNVKSNYRGTADTAVETGPGKGKAAMLEPDRRGNRGWQQCHIPAPGKSMSQDSDAPGEEAESVRMTPLSGTLD